MISRRGNKSDILKCERSRLRQDLDNNWIDRGWNEPSNFSFFPPSRLPLFDTYTSYHANHRDLVYQRSNVFYLAINSKFHFDNFIINDTFKLFRWRSLRLNIIGNYVCQRLKTRPQSGENFVEDWTEGLTEVCSSNQRGRFVFDIRLSSMTEWRMIFDKFNEIGVCVSEKRDQNLPSSWISFEIQTPRFSRF